MKMKKNLSNKRVAGIVLYNPEILRLQDNISALLPQVDQIILFDNHSTNISDIQKIIKNSEKCKLIINGENIGVAGALNHIARIAIDEGAQWLLTMDQDSICNDHIIDKYTDVINTDRVASITCMINDRSFQYENIVDSVDYPIDVTWCITSGNYIKLDVFKELGGFDEKLFIDKVDTDYCYRLIENGYRILKIPYYGLLHEIGSKAKRYNIFGKEFIVFNHSAFRCYYIIRNQIYFARKHRYSLGLKKYHRYIRTAWTRIFVYVFFEKNKIKKLKAWCHGIFDGYKMSI